jgi:diaminopimelate epimerase
MADMKFYKWQGTGNDFVILDNREEKLTEPSSDMIKYLCDRRYGIGADGLMVLNNNPIYDFSMQYFNSDGLEAEMCGNGGRCMIGFAHQLGIIGDDTRFMAFDGLHVGRVLGDDKYLLQMIDLNEFRKTDNYYFLNTGVPHVVKFVNKVDKIDVLKKGRKIRNNKDFEPAGTNVNFVQKFGKGIKIRTYERGVENETLSCGTGAVASAIAAYLEFGLEKKQIKCLVPGGELLVRFERNKSGEFSNISLEGPAKQVYSGEISL